MSSDEAKVTSEPGADKLIQLNSEGVVLVKVRGDAEIIPLRHRLPFAEARRLMR